MIIIIRYEYINDVILDDNVVCLDDDIVRQFEQAVVFILVEQKLLL